MAARTTSSELMQLQRRQKEHDRECHPDIYFLPYQDRMRHLVLHFAKYVGRLATPHEQPEEARKNIAVTLADTFIVVLSASELLKMDLHEELHKMFGGKRDRTLESWAATLDQDPERMEPAALQTWWMNRMAVPTGQMAKAMESLDHMEPVGVRTMLSAALMEILASVLIAGRHLKVDLAALVGDRWKFIEDHQVL